VIGAVPVNLDRLAADDAQPIAGNRAEDHVSTAGSAPEGDSDCLLDLQTASPGDRAGPLLDTDRFGGRAVFLEHATRCAHRVLDRAADGVPHLLENLGDPL